MNALGKLFLKGLAVTIPVALTLAIIWWLASLAERLLGGLMAWALPSGWYLPGMGLVSALALILLVGLLSHVLIFQKLFEWGENLFNRLPLVKSIYTAIKELMGYLSGDSGGQFNKVVMVQLPGQVGELLGFVTREQFDDVPLAPRAQDPVAVYMPMSYQIGGYTLYLPRSMLTPVDLSFEQGMRLAITGGLTANSRAPTQEDQERSKSP